ncbi:MAG: TerB family tellurite resistance protein [Anaerohalosphaeraceae bacterium]|nr:TerB family tellurite resistance protein [Anaerohalosphaeraceae bacterium]
MNQGEQIQYLANIFHLASTDGQLDVEEDSIIVKIAESIGGGYLESRKALDMSLENGFKIALPARFSDCIRCIEDMLLVSFCDKKLHEMEKAILSKYAKKLGISKEQFNAIRQQTKKRLTDLQ